MTDKPRFYATGTFRLKLPAADQFSAESLAEILASSFAQQGLILHLDQRGDGRARVTAHDKAEVGHD